VAHLRGGPVSYTTRRDANLEGDGWDVLQVIGSLLLALFEAPYVPICAPTETVR
jgi:hypothetical protein